MGIREILNKNPRAASIGAILLTTGALALVVWQVASSGAPSISPKTFYTIDDGKTWFEDDIDKPFPFVHEGKQAYLAHVFQVNGKPAFVPYVMRMNNITLKEAESLRAKNDPDFSIKLEALRRQGLEVKLVGDAKWYSLDSPGIQKRMDDASKTTDGLVAEPLHP